MMQAGLAGGPRQTVWRKADFFIFDLLRTVMNSEGPHSVRPFFLGLY